MAGSGYPTLGTCVREDEGGGHLAERIGSGGVRVSFGWPALRGLGSYPSSTRLEIDRGGNLIEGWFAHEAC